MTLSQTQSSWYNQARNLPCFNVSAETIPAFGVVRVAGRSANAISGGTVLEVDKPDGTGTVFAANGSGNIPVFRHGRCSMDWPASVLASSTGDIGPVSGSFTMSSGGTGFRTIGNITDGRVLVQSSAAEPQTLKPVIVHFKKVLQYTGPTEQTVPNFNVDIIDGNRAWLGISTAIGDFDSLPWTYDDDETDIQTNGNIVIDADFTAMLSMHSELHELNAENVFAEKEYQTTLIDGHTHDTTIPLDFGFFGLRTSQGIQAKFEIDKGSGFGSGQGSVIDAELIIRPADMIVIGENSSNNFGILNFVSGDKIRVSAEVPILDGSTAGFSLGRKFRVLIWVQLLPFNGSFEFQTIGVQS